MSFVNSAAQTIARFCDPALPAAVAGATVGALGSYAINWYNTRAAAAAKETTKSPEPAQTFLAEGAFLATIACAVNASNAINLNALTKYSLVNLTASHLKTAAFAFLGIEAGKRAYSYVKNNDELKDAGIALGKLFAAGAATSLVGYGLKMVRI